MKVLLSWLREFAPFDADPDDIGDALGALGHAGRGDDAPRRRARRRRRGAGPRHCGRIPTPTASSSSTSTPATASRCRSCCGAFNMSVGDLVPLATIGTTHAATAWRSRAARSAASGRTGCCARRRARARPTTPAASSSSPTAATPGTPLREALGIESDVLYDLEINPNRPDAMSVAGVARDLAA